MAFTLVQASCFNTTMRFRFLPKRVMSTKEIEAFINSLQRVLYPFGSWTQQNIPEENLPSSPISQFVFNGEHIELQFDIVKKTGAITILAFLEHASSFMLVKDGIEALINFISSHS